MNEDWKDKHYAYFSNRLCEYFPCHNNADPDNFNCLFCYCPLYLLGNQCGGNPLWIDDGKGGSIKDCSSCLFPHKRENYVLIVSKWNEIASLMKK